MESVVVGGGGVEEAACPLVLTAPWSNGEETGVHVLPCRDLDYTNHMLNLRIYDSDTVQGT